MTENVPLSAKALCWRCAPDLLAFETTDDLQDLGDVIGQNRAVASIGFAVAMRQPGYNVYALGPDGIGKHTIVRRYFEQAAAESPVPDDCCYVSNFQDSRKPRTLRLPPGRGAAFQNDMAQFVEDVRLGLRSTFESGEYRTRQQAIQEEFRERRDNALAEVEVEAKSHGIALLRTPVGFAFGPIRDDKVISPEVFQSLSKEEQARVQATIEELQEKLLKVLQQTPVWMKEAQNAIRQLNDETAELAVGHLIETLRKKYADLPKTLD
jgi:hypothetical protein